MAKIKFSALLATPPSHLVKQADVDHADQEQLEKDFGNMAFVFFKDRAKLLLPYLLGFEVVEKEEDGSKNVGLFGCKVNEDYYYVPVFFINNQIKGMDSLFSKSTNSFVPLRENWINSILNLKPMQLGKTGDQKARADFESPDFRFMAIPPINKFGMAADDVSTMLKQAWADIKQSTIDALQHNPEFQQALTGAVNKLANEFNPLDQRGPDGCLHDFMAKTGTIDVMRVLLKTASSNREYANAFYTFYDDLNAVIGEPKLKQKTAEVVVVTAADDLTALTPAEKTAVLSDGFVILDKRAAAKKSIVENAVTVLHTPTESGYYEVLLRNGEFKDAWVLMPDGKTNSDLIVTVPKEGLIFKAPASHVHVKGDKKEAASLFDKATPASKMKTGTSYLIVNDNLIAAGPFHIDTTMGKGVFNVYRHYVRSGGGYSSCSDFSYDKGGNTRDVDTIEVTPAVGPNLLFADRKMYVPANWKAIRIGEDDKSEKAEAPKETPKDVRFEPGTINDMFDVMFKNGEHKLVVEKDPNGSAYYIHFDEKSRGSFSYKQASVALVTKLGMPTEATAALLKQASEHRRADCWVKLADDLQSQMVGVSMPTPYQPGSMGDDWTGAQITEPYETAQRGNMYGQGAPPQPLQPGINIGGQSAVESGQGGMQPDATGLANRAAQAGQKSVFDHSTIGGLSHVYDVSNVVDEFIPLMLKSLDAVGRVLFLFYWKNEEFSDRYGDQSMAELEDLIRGVFKSYGDMILKLKQKSIDTAQSTDMLAAN